MNLSPEMFEKLMMVVITAIFTAIPTWLLSRPKQAAEIGSIHATTDKMFYQMAVEMQEKLPVWIERYEKETEEKMELQGLLRFAEGEMHRLSRALKACTDNNAECKKIIDEARTIMSEFETALTEALEHAPLLAELKEFRRRLEKIES